MTGVLSAANADVDFEIFDEPKPSVDTLLYNNDTVLQATNPQYNAPSSRMNC